MDNLKIRRRPTLPRRCRRSTIGSERLNCRVRDGNGCVPLDTITGKLVNSLTRTGRPSPGAPSGGTTLAARNGSESFENRIVTFTAAYLLRLYLYDHSLHFRKLYKLFTVHYIRARRDPFARLIVAGALGLISLAGKSYGQASGLISTGQLHALLRLHSQPINVVVYDVSHCQDLSPVRLHA